MTKGLKKMMSRIELLAAIKSDPQLIFHILIFASNFLFFFLQRQLFCGPPTFQDYLCGFLKASFNMNSFLVVLYHE